MSKQVKICDSISIESPEYIFRNGTDYFDAKEVLHLIDKKNTEEGQKLKLKVSGPATFADKLTNGRIYPKDEIIKGASSWLKPYNKPVLKHHASGVSGPFGPPAEDPIGRVIDYKFINFKGNPQRDWYVDGVIKPNPKGTGVLHLSAEITDKDSVEKVLDKRLLTTSVGFSVKGLTCNICNQNWVDEGVCDHRPGRVYKVKVGNDKRGAAAQKVAYLIADGIKYLEWSFVNVPAAEGASITSVEKINDALSDFDSQIPVIKYDHLLFDSLTLEDTSFSIIKPEEKEVIDLTSEDCASCKTCECSAEGESTEEDEEEEQEYSDEEVAYANVLKSLVDTDLLDYEALEKEDGLTKDDVEQIIKILSDAKLTAKQRKSLKKNQFCHPSAKAFPAHDCPHVRAGFRLLNRAKVSESTKTKIRACLNRKNKALGCGVNSSMSKKQKEPKDNLEQQEVVQDQKEVVTNNQEVEENTKADASEDLVKKVEELEKALQDAQEKISALVEENNRLLEQNQLHLAEKLFDLRVSTKHPSVTDIENPEQREQIIKQLAARSQGSLLDAIKDEEERLEAMKGIHSLPRGVVSQQDAGVVVKEDKSQSDELNNKKNTPKDYKEIIRKKLQGAK